MTNSFNSDKTTERRSNKSTIILLSGVLLMQVAIFIAIIYPHSQRFPEGTTPTNKHTSTVINTKNKYPYTTINQATTPFSVIDNEIARLMSTIFSPPQQSRINATKHYNQMVKTMNNAMQSMNDLMSIDSGWDMINISPAMDMRDKKDSYEIYFSIPSSSASNITVELNGQLLNMYIPIHITTPGYNEFRTYKQQILIPGPISTNTELKATISNSVLRVILPKGTNNDIHCGHIRLL